MAKQHPQKFVHGYYDGAMSMCLHFDNGTHEVLASSPGLFINLRGSGEKAWYRLQHACT